MRYHLEATMKTQQLLSTSIICIITASNPLSAGADAAAPSDATSLVSRDVAEHRLDRKGDRIEERFNGTDLMGTDLFSREPDRALWKIDLSPLNLFH